MTSRGWKRTATQSLLWVLVVAVSVWLLVVNALVLGVGAFVFWGLATAFAWTRSPDDRSWWQEMLVWIDKHTDY